MASPPTQRQRVSRDANFYRLALLVLLTLLAVVGLHASTSAPVWGSHTKAYDAEVAGALEVIAIVLFLVLVVRHRRASSDPPMVARLRTALMYVLAAGMVALAIALIDLLVNLHLPTQPLRGTRTAPFHLPGRLRLPKSSSASNSSFPFSEVFYGIAAALLLAAIVWLALKAIRNRRVELLPELEPPAEEYGSTLEEAILGGQRALQELDDARAAIIACYVAMEASLAQAGTARSVAETPDELLAKAARELLISPGPASRLTSLFYEARFSSHPLDSDDKQAAELALAELAAQLGGRRVAEAGAGS
ncbi:MAG TPA: DUF4129 domain-containing protein [Acidimicrobiales bacterium]|nr:DUF4129 domain-containing protein [Acidimicrobiales bacterium]